ncbi:hypothetical protein BLJ79_07545 [Arthrobacter sp. UCD-GKA]|uniref:DUF4383 domain-containing protein n=1 Tax=Arthrobacter sp. UCD-GKA TaxID=1913576 RepID=UPI0008DDA4F6|nr:DUF4383 domain-containing protein [Arthrobacter sp. UCD-GKA]OIH85045.1 hypothetical protein BLJ79_07545 [Arthrobacter sp. UCD-GKA]
MASTHTTTHRSLVQYVALAVGAVFLLVGVLGFIPGITSNTEHLGMAGHHSSSMLLGIFQVSVLHNVVHLLFGVLGVMLWRNPAKAKAFLVVGGIFYLVLGFYGVFIDQSSTANFVPVNTADNVLHFALGVGMAGLGLVLGRNLAPARRAA